jgi:polar amino acid transport system substrate-binding protein
MTLASVKRRLLLSLGLALFALPVHAAAPACAAIAAKYPSLAGKTLKIGQDGEIPPFSFRDSKDFTKLEGLDADLARAVFACLGVPVTFVTGNWSGLIPALIASQIDVMWDTLLYTPERAKRIDFVVYMGAATGVMVLKGNPKGFKSLDDLCGVRVTAGLGTTQEAQLHDASLKCVTLGKRVIQIVPAPDISGSIRLVQNGRVDAFSTNKALVSSVTEKMPGLFDFAFDIQTASKIAVGVAKNRAELRSAILEALQAIAASGEMKRIFDANRVDYGLALRPEVLAE